MVTLCMMKDLEVEIVRILYKSITNQTIEPGEQQLLSNWTAISPYNQMVCEELNDNDLLEKEVKMMLSEDTDALWKQISKNM
jgi:hypothetical protein